MKRKAIKKYSDLYRSWTFLIWHKCEKCNQEFRREWGWRALTGPFFNGSGIWRYLCFECAPKREIADEYFLNQRWMPSKPKGIPPHPPPLPFKSRQQILRENTE